MAEGQIRGGALVLVCVALLASGCKAGLEGRAPDTGTYGPAAVESSQRIARAREDRSAEQPWLKSDFAVIQTELSPATLYHSRTKSLSFFTHMAETGIGGPTFCAISTELGPKIFKPGDMIDPAKLRESWFLVWFAGAPGWTNWDSPWFVTLQHRPSVIQFDTNGLHFTFANEAGYAAIMPLYGYYKPPQKSAESSSFYAQRDKKKRVTTWEWEKALHADPLARARYWASALREFPLYCEDSFSIDRGTDSLIIRQKFRWLSWDDDWKTKHWKLAPISPPLAHAFKEGFPVTFSKKPFDMEIFTPYGPLYGVEQVDSYEATLPVLRYVNETEIAERSNPSTNSAVAAAREKLQKTARVKFNNPDKYHYDHGGLNNFCWAIQGDQWYAKALPYMDEQTRAKAIASLKKYFHEDVLVTNRFQLREFPRGSGHSYYILEGPGIGSWNVLGNAGKFSANMLETLWAYAHFTGDWELIRERWPLVKKLFVTPAQTRWISFARDEIAELGDEAAPCLAMARMAYKVGDVDTYNHACQMFARELVHHWLKQRGAKYFREHQPWHSMEEMDEEVYLTNLWGDLAGWQIDGPDYPKKTGERQFNNRWVRFKDADVGRFYRDWLQPEVKRELDLLQTRWKPDRQWKNDSYIMPSLVQLRSLLLNEAPHQLARIATPDQFTGPPSGIIASCISVLRTGHPTRYERLIPGGAASPFVAGLEREVPGPNTHFVQNAVTEMRDGITKEITPMWPRVSWWGWKTPAGVAWNFGQITPTTNAPARAESVPLNWNTRVTVFRDQ